MRWYGVAGRHHLPWRATRDPWAVLVTEVMLQQTSVSRVLPRWESFLARWPEPARAAAEPLETVLREWDGLGYPRRARALWETAAIVAANGWPADEAGLLALPGVGAYTARALLAFSFGAEDCAPPRDVNLGRVAARAALGVEPHAASSSRLDAELISGRPAATPLRDYTFALFDLGATLCRARTARCEECPLTGCRSRGHVLERLTSEPPPRRQAAYSGSLRQLRGAVLRELLGPRPPVTVEELTARVAAAPAASRAGAVAEALAGLTADGLIDMRWRPTAMERAS